MAPPALIMAWKQLQKEVHTGHYQSSDVNYTLHILTWSSVRSACFLFHFIQRLSFSAALCLSFLCLFVLCFPSSISVTHTHTYSTDWAHLIGILSAILWACCYYDLSCFYSQDTADTEIEHSHVATPQSRPDILPIPVSVNHHHHHPFIISSPWAHPLEDALFSNTWDPFQTVSGARVRFLLG